MRLRQVTLLGALLMLGTMTALLRAMPQQGSNAGPVTFNKHVLPILQKNCQTCHRPGEIAPMSFLTYQEVRPWAKAIEAAVVKRQMPPWFADPAYGHFANDKRLTDAEIVTLSAWADGGAVEGDAKDKPAPIAFHDGWNIEPDMIIEMPKDFNVPATGTVTYKNILVKVNFPEDVWVVSAEMRPGNPQVLHHGRVLVRPPASEFMKDAVPGEAYETTSVGMQGKESLRRRWANSIRGWARRISISSNRQSSCRRDPTWFSICTTPRSAKRRRIDPASVWSSRRRHPDCATSCITAPPLPTWRFRPRDGNAEIVSEMTTNVDMKLVYVQPHMHLRGKDYELRLVYPTGKTETVFRAKWDFNWQMGYDLAEPKSVAERHAHRRCRPFRQFRREQVQSRPEYDGLLG